MRRLLFFILILCTGYFSGWGQTTETVGIQFEPGTWEEALQKARQTDKPLFVDVWASWCGPCKRLSNEIFTQAEVGKFFNTHFICYKLQTDPKDPALREEATRIADTYQVAALPTLLWLTADGKLLHSSVGFLTAEKLLENARQATDPEHNTAAVLQRWAQGDRSLHTGMVFFEANRDSIGLFDEFYLNLPREDKLNTALMYKMMFGLRLTAHHRALQYIATHWDDVYAPDSMASSWRTLLQNTLERSFQQAHTEAERDEISQLYACLPYASACRDMAQAKQLIRQKEFDAYFSLLRDMTARHTDLFFLHAMIIDMGYALAGGELEEQSVPSELAGWTEQYIAQKTPSPYWTAYYRATVTALTGTTEETARQVELLKAELRTSGYDASFQQSVGQHADRLLEAARRKNMKH